MQIFALLSVSPQKSTQTEIWIVWCYDFMLNITYQENDILSNIFLYHNFGNVHNKHRVFNESLNLECLKTESNFTLFPNYNWRFECA